MTKDIQHYFWDSCVFIRYLTSDPKDYVTDIGQYIDDAKNGKIKIHISTIALAEIRPSHLIKKGFSEFSEFIKDFQSAFAQIGPSPTIMQKAAALRDFKYPHPDKGANDRVLSIGDAIQLLTCIYAKETLGLESIIFHTLDDGKGKTWEGKCVPLLSFEKYIDGVPKNSDVTKIKNLKRQKPIYISPKFDL